MKVTDEEIVFNDDGSCYLKFIWHLDEPVHFIPINILVNEKWPSGGTVDAADLKSAVAKTT